MAQRQAKAIGRRPACIFAPVVDCAGGRAVASLRDGCAGALDGRFIVRIAWEQCAAALRARSMSARDAAFDCAGVAGMIAARRAALAHAIDSTTLRKTSARRFASHVPYASHAANLRIAYQVSHAYSYAPCAA
ncbi:hypothetical protein [Burkholderia oklahomensis]|uniref:hypothetical protein n=1 Tax=Burkholderia oklahomensis TaxID=342113 RepID=UPI0002F3517F|nr:hypothetical protein [Burkholderia oklahomensis]